MIFIEWLADMLVGLVMLLAAPNVRCTKCGAAATWIKMSEARRIWRCRECDYEWPWAKGIEKRIEKRSFHITGGE